LSGCALAASASAGSETIDALSDDSAKPGIFRDWIAVDSTTLDAMRGGFDIAPGLKVSFGIERVVNLNGVLQTATRIEVPDAGKLVLAPQSSTATALPSSLPASSSNPAASAPAGAVAPGGTITLPAATDLGNGATALIQNGLGNTVNPGLLSPETAATVIQNSASNQTIQSVTVINAATNSLELLKGANLHSTLLDALTQSARSR
jgi:hypothetical protein